MKTAVRIGLPTRVTTFELDFAKDALFAVNSDSIDGAAVIVPCVLSNRWGGWDVRFCENF